MLDTENGCVNWPRDSVNGRLLCTPALPRPPGSHGSWSHAGAHCTYSGDYHDRYECRDCGARWTEEIPE